MSTFNDDTQVLNRLADHAYAVAKKSGFHEHDERNERFAEFIANLHGELSELWEAYRRHQLNEKCDKPIDLTCAEEELADIVLRTLDVAKTYNIDLGKAVRIKCDYNTTREYMHGKLV